MQRSVVLVTGMSDTGTSSVLAELARRGHRVVDTDDPGWFVRDAGGEPLWDRAAVGGLLAEHRSRRLFVAGCVANQGALYALFDRVALLGAPVDVLLARVADRANPFGRTAADREEVAADTAVYEPLLRAGADAEVVTTVPVAEVATALERLAAEPRRRRDGLSPGRTGRPSAPEADR